MGARLRNPSARPPRTNYSMASGRSPGSRAKTQTPGFPRLAPSHALHSGILQTFYSFTVAGAASDLPAVERTHRLPVSFHGRTVSENLKRYHRMSICTDEKTCKHKARRCQHSSCIHPDPEVMCHFSRNIPMCCPADATTEMRAICTVHACFWGNWVND